MGTLRDSSRSSDRFREKPLPIRIMQVAYIAQAFASLGYFLVNPIMQIIDSTRTVPYPSPVLLTALAVPTVVTAAMTWWRRQWSGELGYLLVLSIFIYGILCGLFWTWWPMAVSSVALIFLCPAAIRARRS